MSDDPIAFFITWTTYGTWLPGDERGWVEKGRPGIQAPDPQRKAIAESRLAFDPVCLEPEQRTIVNAAIEEEAVFRELKLFARNARTNHVHLVVTARDDGKKVRDRFKAWCSRKLNEACGKHAVWWTRGGWVERIHDESHLDNAVQYKINQ